ncbi:Carbohydrate kinase, FGGY, N-terminal [Phytophthora cactorum]|nr:Carbohydrate kinase, FGGY, N-terminal [Phytophthora cactorum]
MIRKWLSNRSELEAAVALDTAGRKLGSGRRPNAAIDSALLQWVKSQQQSGKGLTDREMQEQARRIAETQGVQGFHASNGYIYSFKKRNKLSTTTGNKTKTMEPTGVTVQVSQEAEAVERDCMFGMDIGLKNIKCALVCATSGSILATSSAPIQHDAKSQESEQNVTNILLAVLTTVQALPTSETEHSLDRHLWSDQRCTPAMLTEWRAKIQLINAAATATPFGIEPLDVCASTSPIASGYGLATFAYMMERQPSDIAGFDACGTIQDFIAFALCGHSIPAQNCMDVTDAFSWGGFDINTKTWNPHTVQALNLPAHMLPTVKAPGAIIGQSSDVAAVLGLPNGKPVYLAMGDHPCAVMTAMAQTRGPADLNLSRTSVLSVGSASQLAMVLTEEDATQLKQSRGSCSLTFEVRPFLSENWYLGVAGSLSGGNIFAWFVKQCQAWSRQLAVDQQPSTCRMMNFSPTLYGEWASPDVRGSIEQLRISNWSLGDISAPSAAVWSTTYSRWFRRPAHRPAPATDDRDGKCTGQHNMDIVLKNAKYFIERRRRSTNYFSE